MRATDSFDSMQNILMWYYRIIAVLFVGINNFIPSKMYGRFIGLSKSFLALFVLLFINLLEKVSLLILKGAFFSKDDFLSLEFYGVIMGVGVLLFIQLFFSSDPDKYFTIEKELRKLGLSKKIRRTFFALLIVLIAFSLYYIKKVHGKS